MPINIDETHLHHYTIHDGWKEKVHAPLSEAEPVQELIFENVIVSKEGLAKLIKEEDLSRLTVLNFNDVVLNKDHMDLLLLYDFVYKQLETLVLDFCNLEDGDFDTLKERKTKVRKLSLAGKQNNTQATTSAPTVSSISPNSRWTCSTWTWTTTLCCTTKQWKQ